MLGFQGLHYHAHSPGHQVGLVEEAGEHVDFQVDLAGTYYQHPLRPASLRMHLRVPLGVAREVPWVLQLCQSLEEGKAQVACAVVPEFAVMEGPQVAASVLLH